MSGEKAVASFAQHFEEFLSVGTSPARARVATGPRVVAFSPERIIVAGGDIAESILDEMVFIQEWIEVADARKPAPFQSLIESCDQGTPSGCHGACAARPVAIAAADIHAERCTCSAGDIRELSAIEIRIAPRRGRRRGNCEKRGLPVRTIHQVADPTTRSTFVTHIPDDLTAIRMKAASATGENERT